jgi:hypothetical protein
VYRFEVNLSPVLVQELKAASLSAFTLKPDEASSIVTSEVFFK